MHYFGEIQRKLEGFIRKFHLNQLLRGIMLFTAIGLLYFLATLFIEYFLWLKPTARTILFWAFVAVEMSLFVWLIALPLFRLFKLKKGIEYEQASKLIGKHFHEVSDKLINILQLQQSKEKSDLLLASIEQKSAALHPIPFQKAINFRQNAKYLKYVAIPLLIALAIWASGNTSFFTESYQRVVNYKEAYTPPAPFTFAVLNEQLQALEGQSLKLRIATSGDVVPVEAKIHFNEESYFLKNEAAGMFSFEMPKLSEQTSFYLTANDVTSDSYAIAVVPVPSTTAFELFLDYPAYTGIKDEVLTNTGSATIPEGTSIQWKVNAQHTDYVEFITEDTLQFQRDGETFAHQKRVYRNLKYTIALSNQALPRYEELGYQLRTIKDQSPEIKVNVKKDSSDVEALYFQGQVSDDYSLSELKLFWYPSDNRAAIQSREVAIKKQAFDVFYEFFPGEVPIEEGIAYEIYFEVTDNDALRAGKKTKSKVFSFRKRTKSELEEEQLLEQKESIQKLDNSINKLQEQQKALKELSRTQKEKEQLNFDEQQKLKSFLQQQQQQEALMQRFTKELEENLRENEDVQDEEFKKLLEERLERQNKEFEKNEEFLKQLEELAKKIDKEELSKRLEELGKQQANDKRNLQQLLELTKRYYVAEKTQKLAEDLKKLAEKQEEASKKSSEENTSEGQKELNKEFEQLEKELEELQKANDELRKPMDLPKEQKTKEEIRKEQQEATEQLEQRDQQQNAQEQQQSDSKARKNQQQAARMMQKLGNKMEMQMASGGQSQEMEDAEMLRQILDNLLVYSLEQEGLMEEFMQMEDNSPSFTKSLKRQYSLRQVFEHVDDSLFSLSLRRPEIGEFINKEITEVYFNVDKSIARFSDNRLYQGIGSQQYALTASNNLASMLSDVLDQMQQNMSMSSSGGQGQQGFQLPDIIKSQEDLNQQMQDGMEGKQKGQQGEQRQPGQQGEKGDEGDSKGNSQQNGNQQEQQSEELFEIYKQQQQLRQQLEEQLKDLQGEGNKAAGDKLVRDMERIERELLERGMNPQTLQRMLNLKHELLKLDKATFEQGKKKERESRTNRRQFQSQAESYQKAREYFNQTEILNRQPLPLQIEYQKRIQVYFKGKDD